jgi:plastocyanin
MTVGGTFQRAFASPGTHTYHCANHPGMTGTIVVTP